VVWDVEIWQIIVRNHVGSTIRGQRAHNRQIEKLWGPTLLTKEPYKLIPTKLEFILTRRLSSLIYFLITNSFLTRLDAFMRHSVRSYHRRWIGCGGCGCDSGSCWQRPVTWRCCGEGSASAARRRVAPAHASQSGWKVAANYSSCSLIFAANKFPVFLAGWVFVITWLGYQVPFWGGTIRGFEVRSKYCHLTRRRD